MIRELLSGRPAVLAALGLICGIMLAQHIDVSSPEWCGALLLLISFAIVLRRNALTRLLIVASTFVIFGAILSSLDTTGYRGTRISDLASMKPEKVVLVGRVEDFSESKSEYMWRLATDSIGLSGERHFAARASVLVRLFKEARGRMPLPQPGDVIRVYAALAPFRPPTNPHEFASALKLQTDTHTEAQAFLHSRWDYEVLSKGQPDVWRLIAEFVADIHDRVTALLHDAIRDPESRSFVEAVVLGERSEMDKETLSDFTTSGVSHILAVSGFNVAVVALVVSQLLRLLGIYWHRTRIAVTMGMVFIYCAVVGFQPSVVRALIMIELYQLALLLERKPDPLNIIASAVLLELLVRPWDLFDVGFQLSYSAVLGLILLAPKIKWLLEPVQDRLASRYWQRGIEAVALSAGASIASYPVIASQFYRVSFVGLVANLPLIPLSAVITAYGFLLIPLAAISTPLAQVYGDATSYMTHALLWVTRESARVPFASHAASPPTWIFVAMIFAGMIYSFRASTWKSAIGRLTLAFAALLTLSTIGIPMRDSVLAKNDGKLQVLYFDVEEGDCMLVRCPSGKSYVVDFGTVNRSGFSQAERTLIPFLRAENATAIDAGIISHMHLDHCGGAPAVIEQCSVGEVMTSGEREPSPTARKLDSLVRVQHIPVRALSRGDVLQLDSDVALYVLHPDRVVQSQYAARGQSINAGSLAFRLVYGKTSFLFLGDVERSEEEEMLATYGSKLHSDVVKVAHHGSLTSSSREFVKAASPKFAVISVGENNRFGHPAAAVVKRWMSGDITHVGAEVCRTDEEGAILLVSDGESVQRQSWR